MSSGIPSNDERALGEVLLTQADLTDGWQLVPGWPDGVGADREQLDAALHYTEHPGAPGAERRQWITHNNLDEGRWYLIQHAETAARAMLRMQRRLTSYSHHFGEIRITGLVVLPEYGGDPVTSLMLRDLPIAQIEANANRRLFAVTGASRFENGKLTLPSGRKITHDDLRAKLPDPKKDPDFYELVALQHTRLTENGVDNPTAVLAERNGVALSTAQGWVARARTKGLLPPGRRGRAG